VKRRNKKGVTKKTESPRKAFFPRAERKGERDIKRENNQKRKGNLNSKKRL